MQSEPSETHSYEPSHEAVAKLSYCLWLDDGQQSGKDKEYWDKAECLLKEKHHRHHHHGNEPHTTLEGGVNSMSQREEDLKDNERNDNQEQIERRDDQVNAGINPPVDINNQPIDTGNQPVDTEADENRNKGVADNTEDKNPAGTDKSHQPPIGGSDQPTAEDSVTSTQSVGPLNTQGGNGAPGVDPLATGADSLQNKQDK